MGFRDPSPNPDPNTVSDNFIPVEYTRYSMKPVCVVGAEQTFIETLVRHLEPKGPVATISSTAQSRDVSPKRRNQDITIDTFGAASYTLSDEGVWYATGTEERSVSDLLNKLAPDYDYVVLDGFADADLPTIAVGEDDFAGPEFVSTPDSSSLDINTLVDCIDEIEPYETLESLVARAKQSSSSAYAGAIATFTGRVRRKEHKDDTPTEYLEFEKYEGVAETKMNEISEELTDRDGVYEVLLHHRVGVIEAEEDIVFVVVLAGHRDQAFRTVSDGINRLKDEVPLFKKEVTVDGEFWSHQCDHASSSHNH